MSSLIRKLFLVLAGVILSLALLEATLQLLALTRSWKKDFRNSAVRKATCTILCLGESTTDGQYPWLLEEILNSRGTGTTFRVIDKGRGGVTTSYILRSLNRSLDEYRPDIVVTMMGANDTRDDLAVFEYRGPFYSKLRTYTLMKLLKNRLKTRREDEPKAPPAATDRASAMAAGEFYKSEKNYREAERMFLKAAEFDPRDENALIALGWMYLAEKRFGEADAMAAKARALNPSNSYAYVLTGAVNVCRKEYEEAEAVLKKAISLDAQSSDAYKRLAHAYREQEKFREAEAMLLKVIGLAPQDSLNYIDMGTLYRGLRRYEESEAMFNKALRLNPQDRMVYEQMDRLYRKSGQSDKLAALHETREAVMESMKTGGASFAASGSGWRIKNLDKEKARERERVYPLTQYNYRTTKDVLSRRGVRWVCAQYPTMSVEPLKRVLEPADGIVFVDNEGSFNSAVEKDGYDTYFTDRFKETFGHCTYKGNQLLASNIADAIITAYFKP